MFAHVKGKHMPTKKQKNLSRKSTCPSDTCLEFFLSRLLFPDSVFMLNKVFFAVAIKITQKIHKQYPNFHMIPPMERRN
jgi:hypothetical protein